MVTYHQYIFAESVYLGYDNKMLYLLLIELKKQLTYVILTQLKKWKKHITIWYIYSLLYF
jgi:hypothetical protein